MPITVTFAYPSAEGSTFNKEYYMSSHVPNVIKVWKEHGLLSWRALTSLNPKTSPYAVIFETDWADLATFQKAQATIDPAVNKGFQEDLVNYYDQKPHFWIAEVEAEQVAKL
ncbi:hypothetical protein BX600DRAFT_429208 [Xylariales sp. PMI_506]|nr:hypothetical protein BX600DRAFT_429208 [Xylariales sp. PMI_506]